MAVDDDNSAFRRAADLVLCDIDKLVKLELTHREPGPVRGDTIYAAFGQLALRGFSGLSKLHEGQRVSSLLPGILSARGPSAALLRSASLVLDPSWWHPACLLGVPL